MQPVTALSLGRIALGALCLTRPRTGAAALGVDAARTPQVTLLAGAFGGREAALGAVTLLARGEARRDLVAAGVAVDAADLLVAVVAGVRREVGVRPALSLGVAGLSAALVGLADLRG